MSTEEAKELLDMIIEDLHALGFINDRDYGRMPESLREKEAEKMVEKMEE